MRIVLLVLAVALCVGVLLAGCGGDEVDVPGAGTVTTPTVDTPTVTDIVPTDIVPTDDSDSDTDTDG